MSSSDVTPSSLGVRGDYLRDALQRAHDGESPDAILEEIRGECCEHHTVCQGKGPCGVCGARTE